MSKYLFNRCLTVLFFAVSLAILAAAIESVIHTPGCVQALSIVLFVAMFLPVGFAKPNWFLLLPYSRRKLAAIHVGETIAFYTIILIVNSILKFYFVHLKHYSAEMTSEFTPLWAVSGLVVFRSALPIFAQGAQRFQFQLSGPEALKSIFKALACYVIGGIAWFYFDQDPLFLYSIALFIIVGLPWCAFANLKTPSRTLKKIRVGTFAAFGILLLISAAVAMYFVEVATPTYAVTDIALSGVGRIPFPLSNERASELFESRWVSIAPLLLRKSKESANLIPHDRWLSKTRACDTSACLDLSDAFLRNDLSSDQQFDAFSEMMKKCGTHLVTEVKLRCSGPKLSPKRLDAWLNRLVTTGEVDRWLQSGLADKQFIAIRALAKSQLSVTQKERIIQLGKEGTRLVRLAADTELSDYALDTSSPNQQTGICKSAHGCQPAKLSDLFW